MARFVGAVEYDVLNEIENLSKKSKQMMSEMVDEAGDLVLNNVKSNMKKAFKTTRSLDKGLRKTRVYKTPSDDGINVNIGFHGYDKTRAVKDGTKAQSRGVPIPLIALAREYGTSSGEEKKPFFRKSFKQSEIEKVMLDVQKRYIHE